MIVLCSRSRSRSRSMRIPEYRMTSRGYGREIGLDILYVGAWLASEMQDD